MSKFFLVAILIPLLCSCQLYASASIHDPYFDSEYEQDNLITTVGASQSVTSNLEVFYEHTSMPFIHEHTGYGVNEVGARIKYKLY